MKTFFNSVNVKISLFSLAVEQVFRGKLDVYSFTSFWKKRDRVFGSKITELVGSTGLSETPKTVFFIHVFYEEYFDEVSKVVKVAATLPGAQLLISTSKESLYPKLQKLLIDTETQGRVALVPNLGRNFAPLFVEFSREIRNFDILISLHSKASKHARHNLGKVWSDRAWKLLGTDQVLLTRVLSLFSQEKDLGLVYPYVQDLLRPINFTWGNNLVEMRKLKKTYEHMQIKDPLVEFEFPIGGMFAARVDAIRSLLVEEWTYDLFPDESGQLDGTLQHALERAIGLICTESGYIHAQFMSAERMFYKLKIRNSFTRSGSN